MVALISPLRLLKFTSDLREVANMKVQLES